MAKILKLGMIIFSASMPLLAIVSCSSFNSEVEVFLNSLHDDFAKETFSDKAEAEKYASQFSKTIKPGEENIPINIVNASTFTNYPLSQKIGEDLVMQLQPLSASYVGTTIILTIRIEYSFNDNISVKHYSQSKDLVVQFLKE